jgi:hypothetical protein
LLFQLHKRLSNLNIEEALERIIEILFFLIFARLFNDILYYSKKIHQQHLQIERLKS